jgi:tRNA threonylcarbamoyladenosine biosynthesis protein TsaE
MIERYCPDETHMRELAEKMAACIVPGLQFNLKGPLGAGKTTLVRGIVQGLGHPGSVKSPTYGLVEGYRLAELEVQHFDLYRMEDPEELEFIGWRDLLGPGVVSFFEWPERGAGVLSEPDVECVLSIQGPGRRLVVAALTAADSYKKQLIIAFSVGYA